MDNTALQIRMVGASFCPIIKDSFHYSNGIPVLKSLMNDEKLNDFVLVVGTALSLRIGHRISIDMDLF